jgi:threonylcarbamoyladenosine tRNA methylthiotransferase MtaB
MARALVLTLGCKVNQYEGEALESALAALGYFPAENGSPVDLAVVNTCTVTARADRKCRSLIRKLARSHPGVPLFVTGCYAERSAADLVSLAGVRGVAADKDALVRLIAREMHAAPRTVGAPARLLPSRTRAYLKVQDGCDSFCSYCIVPHVRPTLRSEPVDRVLTEATRLVAEGFHEIVLTGIHLGRYGADRDDGVTFTEVVRRVAAIDGLARLRLSSIEMPEASDALIDAIASNPVICPHLHLPLQSGDDQVLRAMNRRYAAADYLRTVERVRRRVPDVSLTTDVIAGFPGETDEAFARTVAVAREAGFSRIHVFPFSPRPGTPGAGLPDRPRSCVITARKKTMLRVAAELALAYKRRFVGEVVDVLVEESETLRGARRFLAGMTRHYLRVRFASDDDLHNRFVRVRIKDATPEAMEGELALP